MDRGFTFSKKNKPSTKPSFYSESKLFSPHGKHDIRKTDVIPDPQLEKLEPDEDDLPPARKAINKLNEFVNHVKANEPDTTGKLEGKFKVPLDNMLLQLNSIINAEYSQWFRYYHYSLILRGHCRDATAEELSNHADEELEHAERIAMRVVGLGGYPETSIEQPLHLHDTEEILKELLYREQKGMNLYKEVHALCGENEGTRQLLEGNMEQEQEHIDDLWRFLKNPELVKSMNEKIPGGLSSGRPDSDFDPIQLEAGIKVEMEHVKGSNLTYEQKYAIAKEITKDHLTEDKEYYIKLKKMEKADMSAGRDTMPSEKQAKREYGHSFARFPRGITGQPTPDLPERGRDWHGTVPGVPDEPQDSDEEQKESEEYFKDPLNPLKVTGKSSEMAKRALKALAGAPILPKGPLIAPTEKRFLLENGYTPEEIEAGLATMTPRMRGMYNRDLLSSVRKSLSTFESKKD